MFGVWDFQDDEMGLKKLKCDLGSAVMQRGEELFRRRRCSRATPFSWCFWSMKMEVWFE